MPLYVGAPKNFSVQNLLANADPKKGPSGTGWAYSESRICPDGYSDCSYAAKGSGAELTRPIGDSTGTEIKPTLNNTHKYYFAAWLYQNSQNGSFDFYWPVAEPSVISGATAVSGQWTKVSAVVNRSSFSSGSQSCRIDYNNPSSEYLYISGLVLVDLTATFGSGTEPDKAWCDEHIAFSRNAQTVSRSVARLVAT